MKIQHRDDARRRCRPRRRIGVCGTCMDARAIEPEDQVQAAHRSSMDELAKWTAWAEKVLVF